MKCRLQLVQDVLYEKFQCLECGRGFISQAALRRHEFRHHMTEEQQQRRQEEPRRMANQSVMDHSLDGMPQCRHCQYAFTTWHAFYYHVNTRSCTTLRLLHDQPDRLENIRPESEAIVDNEAILAMSRDCSWRALALHPLVRSRHQHCPECHQWHVRSQYVKRHMLSRHPSQAPLISKAEQLIVSSKLSLQKPCQFCGQDYQRRDAHLRTCAGIFQGVYLYLRIARGRPLQVLEDGSFDRHGGGKAQAQLERGHQRSRAAQQPRPDCPAGDVADGGLPVVQPGLVGRLELSGEQVPQTGQQRTAAKRATQRPRQGTKQGSKSRPARQGQGIRAFLEKAGQVGAGTASGRLDLRPGGGGGDGGLERPSDDCQAPDGPHPTTRIPTLSPSPGRRLRDLPQDRHAEQCGGQHLQDGSAVACYEEPGPGETHRSHEGYPSAAPAASGEGAHGEDDGDAILSLHGHLAWVAQRGREGADGPQVGSGDQAACSGRDGQADRGLRGHGDPHRAHHDDQGAAGGGTVPCHETSQRAVPVAHAYHAAGDRTSHWAGALYVDSLPAACSVGDVGGGGGHS